MSFDSILRNISKHIRLDEEETGFFTSLLETKLIDKKAVLLQEKQPCRYLNFVHSGALRTYCMDKDGREATIMFAMPDWWVTDMYCFINRKPAMMYIEAIEDSLIFRISRNDWEKLLDTVPKFEKLFRILMQNAYTREQLRIIENLSLSAEERYDSFLNKYPHVAGQVTQKQIASYLGITPEFLSAIRKNKSRGKLS